MTLHHFGIHYIAKFNWMLKCSAMFDVCSSSLRWTLGYASKGLHLSLKSLNMCNKIHVMLWFVLPGMGTWYGTFNCTLGRCRLKWIGTSSHGTFGNLENMHVDRRDIHLRHVNKNYDNRNFHLWMFIEQAWIWYLFKK